MSAGNGTSSKNTMVEYMQTKYSMQCVSAGSDTCPTTIHGSYIDLVFTRNCAARMLLKDPLTVHFSDHKAVIVAVRYNDNTNRHLKGCYMDLDELKSLYEKMRKDDAL